MVKATLRSAVLLGLLVWSVPSFAEVQNVKVGGEVTVTGFHRKNLRLSEDVFNNGASQPTSSTAGQVTAASQLGPSGDSFLQQLTAVNVGADLTENVSAEIRVINQRVWGALDDNAMNSTSSGSSTLNNGNDVQLSQANVTLKELFYSPLTVKIGRQPLKFGRGLIIGSRIHMGDVDPNSALAADEFSDLSTGFDAIRGTLDFSSAAGMPLLVDVVYSKIAENAVSAVGGGGVGTGNADDVNLFGFNVGTKLDSMSSEFEAYFWDKRDSSQTTGDRHGVPHSTTFGLRGSSMPADGLSVWGELAYQMGRFIPSGISYDAEPAAGDQYGAWAANFGADFALKDVALHPVFGGEWIFFSGRDGRDPATQVGSGTAGWEPVFHGYFPDRLRSTQTAGFYMPAQSGATLSGTTFSNITNSYTNQHTLAVHGAITPIEDLIVDNRLSWFVTDSGIRPTAAYSERKSFLGSEWDLNAVYNYTDDVQLGAAYSLFLPGSVFRQPYDNPSHELLTSVSVKF